MSVLNIILAIVPGLLISFLIFRFDRHEKEKLLPLIICFILGVAITFPAMQIEAFADRNGIVESPDFWMTVFLSFVVVAMTEELVKFICLIAYPYQNKFFNEPLDGIIYAVMIGMGFATLENILYAGRFGLDTMAVRAFTAVPAHAAFGVVAGYFVGRAKFEKEHRFKLLSFGFLSAVGLHGFGGSRMNDDVGCLDCRLICK
ncbi:MAG: PrsW family glutamic-type intramembrane protease, partial [Bacteroidota bacterium]